MNQQKKRRRSLKSNARRTITSVAGLLLLWNPISQTLSHTITQHNKYRKRLRACSTRRKTLFTFINSNRRTNESSNRVKQSLRSSASCKKRKKELKLYKPPMNDLEEAQKREEQDKVFEFLAIFEPSYDSTRSQILLMLELSTLDKVVAMLEREETRRVVMGQQSA
jgi:hypothetical protein